MGQTLRAALGPASALEEAAEGGEEAFESFILEGCSGTAKERRRAVRRARRRGEEGLAREVECVFVAEDVELLRAARRREESVIRGLGGGTWRGVLELCADELGRDDAGGVLVKGAHVLEGGGGGGLRT